jgi:multiple sugar transport system ATP-binding protein
MNFADCKITKDGKGMWVVEKSNAFKVKVPADYEEKVSAFVDKDIVFGIRPENIYDKVFSKNAVDGENVVSVKVEVIEPLGSETLIHAEVGDGKFVATVLPETGAKPDMKMDLVFDLKKMRLFDPNTEEALI